MRIVFTVVAVVGAALGVVVYFALLNLGLSLVSSASDMDVVSGVVLTALMAAIGLLVTWRVGGKFAKWIQPFAPVVMLAALSALAVGCGTTIPPGHAGIIVDSYGKDRGVQSYTATTGRVWYNPWTTTVFSYPTYVQSVVFTASVNEGKAVNEEITFTNSDQMAISADVSLSYSLLIDKLPAFYVKFRSDDLTQFTYGFLRSLMRDKFNEAAGHYTIAQIMGDNGPFLAEVKKALQADLEPLGVHLESQFGIIGAPRPPSQVVASINMKVQATQLAIQKQNELVQVQADAAKAVAEATGEANSERIKADADSYYNQKLASSLTPLLVENRRIDKWDGKLPTVSGAATPFINLNK